MRLLFTVYLLVGSQIVKNCNGVTAAERKDGSGMEKEPEGN